MSGNTDEVLTHATGDRGYKLCQCFACKEVSLCTPNNDFYTKTADGPGGPLYCEKCMLAAAQEMAAALNSKEKPS